MTDQQRADVLTVRRAHVVPVLAILLITQQTTTFAIWDQTGPIRGGYFGAALWLALAVALLLIVAGPGGWFQRRAVRKLLNDEVSQAHRRSARAAGFVAAMLGAVVVFAVALLKPVSGIQAAHVILSIGIGAAALRFAALERRALR